MPEGTKVEEMYQALLREGKSKESAARIAQAETGLALATGKPPKGKENARWLNPGDKVNTPKGAGRVERRAEGAKNLYRIKLDNGEVVMYEAQLLDRINNSAFQNGRARAEHFINRRLANIASRNQSRGFYGTIEQERPGQGKKLFDEAVSVLKAQHGMSDEMARDYLDSTYGRHVAAPLAHSLPPGIFARVSRKCCLRASG